MANARREEIIAACETLYETMGFKDLTLKEIARYTSLSRPSIYNYFETKEEIFLAILQKEYWSWVEALNRESEEHDTMTKFCRDMTAQDRQDFLYSFFPFIYGIYPYTVVTEKQKRAMEQAIVPYVYYSAYDLTYQFVKKLLG